MASKQTKVSAALLHHLAQVEENGKLNSTHRKELIRPSRSVETLMKPRLVGLHADEQETVDELLHELDGTSNFGKIGGNTACAISLATAMAAASSKAIHLFEQLSRTTSNELPLPLGNVLGGGRHARPEKQTFKSSWFSRWGQQLS